MGRFTHQVGTTFVSQIATVLAALGTGAITARWLGVEGKGMLGLALLLPSMLSLFMSGGLETANVFFAGSNRVGVPTLAANSVALAIGSSCLGTVAVIVLALTGWLARFIPGVPMWPLLLAVLAFPIGLLSGYLRAILQGQRRITTLNAIAVGQGSAVLALTLLMVVGLSWGLAGAILANITAALGGLIATGIITHRAGGQLRPRWNRLVMHDTLAYGMRGYIGNVLQFFNYRLDAFIVNFFVGPSGAGIYGVSVAMAELLWHLPNSVGFVIFPKAAASRPSAMNRFTPRVFGVTLGLTALASAALAAIGRPLIRLIYTRFFEDAYVPLLALLPGVVLLGGAKVLTNEIAGRGYPHYNSISSGMGLIVTLILDLLLIPRHGVLGASIASSLAYTSMLVAAALFYISVSKRTSFDPAPP